MMHVIYYNIFIIHLLLVMIRILFFKIYLLTQLYLNISFTIELRYNLYFNPSPLFSHQYIQVITNGLRRS